MFNFSDATVYIFLTTGLMFVYATYCAYLAATTPRRRPNWDLFWNIVGPFGFGLCGLSILWA